MFVESQSFAFAINPLKMDYLFARTEFATSYTMFNFNFAKSPDSKSSRLAIQHFGLYCRMLTGMFDEEENFGMVNLEFYKTKRFTNLVNTHVLLTLLPGHRVVVVAAKVAVKSRGPL